GGWIRVIELRSDTFTLPTPAMRAAMSHAVVGDDVYGEDPTVCRLERLAADRLGKEAACFMPSGTMANLASILVHCPRGTEVLAGDESDIYHYEAGGASVVGGSVYHPVPTQSDGRLLLADIRAAIRDIEDAQCAPAGLICLENTHNRCGGAVLPLDYLEAVAGFARTQGLPVHMDGARLFNAAIALKVSPALIARHADSVQFCLSKGLSAPIGSIVVGSVAFIKQVRRMRKMLGGGMRQVGLVAAAGIVALEQMVERLVEDHANAHRLALGLAGLTGIEVDPKSVQTNIVLFRVADERWTWRTFVEATRREGIALGELGYGRIRAVTHYGISAEDIDRAVAGIANVLAHGPDRYLQA
ncbi:MAG TPA: low-specificity L-threonine aldolase, partial [Herpetosiphonaceae bacterium]|nr:low-specificity L-threonine aldolase [Herpetosiphonaceae bacterium]